MNQDLYQQLQIVEIMMNDGDIMIALETLEELSQSYPDDYHIASLLGECYLCTGQPDKAIKPLKWSTVRQKYKSITFSQKESNNKKYLINSEQKFVNNLKYKFSERKPNNIWVDHYLLGCAYARCTKFRSAIQHLNVADKINPHNSEIIRNLGWIRCMQEKTDTGRQLLRKAIKLDPKNALAYNDLGASYMFEEKLEEAKRHISTAIKLDPEDEFIKQTSDKLEDLVAYKTIFAKVDPDNKN